MRYFVVITVLYFVQSVVFAMGDHCVSECSQSCQSQAKQAELALYSHLGVCKGQNPTQALPECAQSCSKGCKAFMRGQRQILVDHYDVCGGGDGRLGRVECVKKGNGTQLINSHTLQQIGEVHSADKSCLESAETLEDNILCAKSTKGYAVFSKLNHKLGVGSRLLHQCVETMMTAKNDRVCVRVSNNRFAAYDLNTMQRVGPTYNFLSSCQDEL